MVYNIHHNDAQMSQTLEVIIMSTFTIHSPDPEIERRVREKAHKEKRSLNSVLQDLIAKGMGEGGRGERDRHEKFRKYAGVWSDKDAEDFDGAVEDFEKIDEEEWR